MRFLVTGGAGFIGSNYVRHLLATDPEAQVTNFDKLTYAGNRASVADLEGDPRHRFVQGDICDPDQVAEVMAGQDVVVNFAAETHVDRSIVDPLTAVATNTLGVATLAEAARRAGVGRFLQVGPTSSRRRSSRCSSPTCSTATSCRCTAAAATSATGCTCSTTAAPSTWSCGAARPAASTTSGPTTRSPTWS
jgi:nucleoside-diphosphate-sugar epimerase